MKQASTRVVKSADRTLDLLEYLGEIYPREPNFADISTALEIPKSSLFHLLGNLSERRFVQQTRKGHYTLGPRLAEIARTSSGGASMPALLDPVLRALSLELNETCGLNRLVGDSVEVVASHTGFQALSYTMKVGELAPLYAVSGGKILLSQQDGDWLRSYLGRIRFEKFTPKTIQSADRLLAEIEQARAEGFAYSHDEFTPGIVGLGTAVLCEGRAVAAINVAMPSARFNETAAAQARRALRAAAREASAILDRDWRGNFSAP